jgi:positive regulator of sigma E activity
MGNIVKSWKTTLLGIIVMIAGGAYIFMVESANTYIFIVLLIISLAFLFAKDSTIKALRALPEIILSKFKKKDI